MAGEQGKVRTGSQIGLQLRRLPVRPERGQGQIYPGLARPFKQSGHFIQKCSKLYACITGTRPPGLGSGCTQPLLGGPGPIRLPTGSHLGQSGGEAPGLPLQQNNSDCSRVALRGHGGRVVTLSPPTSAAGVRSPSWP